MEHKAAKKAKKGILSIVFSSTALIVMLILLQIGALVLMYTILNDYLTYVYWITMAVQVFVIIYITNEQGTPEYSRTWILLILILPVFGCLFYVYVKLEIGTKYVGERLVKTKLDTSPYLMQKAEVVEDLRVSKPANATLAYYMNHQLQFPTYRNTKVTYFSIGQEKFAEMIHQLKRAEKYIFLEYFIVSEGYMWDTILDILKEKAKAGVEVRFMYDGMCSISNLPYNYPEQIRKFGITGKSVS